MCKQKMLFIPDLAIATSQKNFQECNQGSNGVNDRQLDVLVLYLIKAGVINFFD